MSTKQKKGRVVELQKNRIWKVSRWYAAHPTVLVVAPDEDSAIEMADERYGKAPKSEAKKVTTKRPRVLGPLYPQKKEE